MWDDTHESITREEYELNKEVYHSTHTLWPSIKYAFSGKPFPKWKKPDKKYQKILKKAYKELEKEIPSFKD